MLYSTHAPLQFGERIDSVVAEGHVTGSLIVLAERIVLRCQLFQLVRPGYHLPVERRKGNVRWFFLALRIHVL